MITQRGNVRARAARVETLEQRRLLSANLVADFGGIYPTDSATIGNLALFAANDGVHGSELWRSDGSATGSRLLMDLTRGFASSTLSNFTVVNGQIFFFKQDARVGWTLWRSDGTGRGTYQLIAPTSSRMVISEATLNGKLIIADWGGTYDPTVNLYASDGTLAGTSLIKQIYSEHNPELAGHYAEQKINVVGDGSRAVFMTDQIWSTDGTTKGTFAIPGPVGNGWATQAIGGKVVYMNYDLKGLWSTDGTVAGTRMIAELPNSTPGSYVFDDAQKIIFCPLNSPRNRWELWVSDGTSGGTLRVADDVQGIYGEDVARLGERCLIPMLSDDRSSLTLWTSDGTVAGTGLLKVLGPGMSMGKTYTVGSMVFFFTNSPTQVLLWRSDGTAAGTQIVEDLTDRAQGSSSNLTVAPVQGKLAVGSYDGLTSIYDPDELSGNIGPARGYARLAGGVLRIFGTRQADSIRLYRLTDQPSRLVVRINGRKQSFLLNEVQKLIVYGYSGDDNIAINEANGLVKVRSRIWAGSGDDTVYTGTSLDTVFGEGGDDLIGTSRNADFIAGGAGDDTIIAGTGNDTLNGNQGKDSLIGGGDDDLLSGGQDESSDHLDGGSGADVIFGKAVFEIFYDGKQSTDGDPLDEVLLG